MSTWPLPVLISEELFLHQNKKLKTFGKELEKVQNNKPNRLQLSEYKECDFRQHQYQQAMDMSTLILALLLLNAVASVLTSNEFEYPNSAC